jgi:hypothetical protein
VITVKLFDQTLLADMEMLYIIETVFGVWDGVQLMDCMHPCLVALAASHSVVECPAIGCSSCSMR